MKYHRVRIKHKHAYLYPIGDIHIGDKAFHGKKGEELLDGYIDFVRKTPNAYIFLMGDVLNVATRASKSSPFEQTMSLDQQIRFATEKFEPVKHKIIGAITGNHELRLKNFVGYDPTAALCANLNIPYFGYSVVVGFRVGKSERQSNLYHGYFHHTTGGGSTQGAAINRVDKLRGIVANADFYVGGHNHRLITGEPMVWNIDGTHERVQPLRQVLVDSGSYLDWSDSYAEMKQMTPNKLGSPRLRLSGEKRQNKDIHVSL